MDADLRRLIDLIVPAGDPLRFSQKAKTQALERAVKLGVDISGSLLQKNQEFLDRLLTERVSYGRSNLLRQVSKITGISSAELLAPEPNESQKRFLAQYGEERLAYIRNLAGSEKVSPPDPQKDPIAHIHYWVRKTRKRDDFLKQLKIILPELNAKELINVLTVTASSQIAHTPAQDYFISQYGEPLLREILAKHRMFTTDPRDWKRVRPRHRKPAYYFREKALKAIITEVGGEAIEAAALRFFDKLLVDWGIGLIQEGLRLKQRNSPARTTLMVRDIELAIKLSEK